ncbi:MAG TPA: hypothetical protein PLF88_00510, partial [Opitutaceae bacterium]|nr:hypothetical protein [Opitutaceae bacterium]
VELEIDFDDDILALGGTVTFGVEIGSAEFEIIGTFYFEQSTVTGADDSESEVIKVSITGGSMTLGVVAIEGINGAFVILESGAAGKLSIDDITIDLGSVPFFLSVDDFYLEFNNTGADVEVSIPVGADPEDAILLSFTGESRHDFILISGSIIIGIGGDNAETDPMLRLEANGVTIDTGATGDEALFSAKLLSGTLNLAALGGAITVSARNLAVTANGKLANYDDPDTAETENFIVEVFFGGTFRETIKDAEGNVTGTVEVEREGETAPDAADLDFKWPAWMPLKLRYIGLEWEDIGAAPADFTLTITAGIHVEVAGLITVSGYVENLVIDVGALLDGDFPIKSFDAAALYVSGNLFGLEVSGGFVLGMIEVDADGKDVNDPDYVGTGDIDDTIFFAGLQVKAMLLGAGGVQFGVGLAYIDGEVVPLEVMVGVAVPILLEPISGLTLGAFAGRVQFATTLDTLYEDEDGNVDMVKLAAVANNPNSAVATENMEDWVKNLKAATLKLAGGNDDDAGPANVWEMDMTITVLANFYSLYVSPLALNGTMVVSFDTQGRILLAGELVFAGGSAKLNAGLYADLSNVDSGDFAFAFYGSYGTSAMAVKPIEIQASLKVMILKEDGSLWDSEDDEADQALLKLNFEGQVKLNAGGAMVLQVDGTIDLEVALQGPTDVRLKFNAQVGLVQPTPNPLGPNFGELAGYLTIFEQEVSADVFELKLYGALKVTFTPATLADYGIDVNATVFLQINTTNEVQQVTLEYFDGDVETIDIRANYFSLSLQGELTIGAPGSAPADAFFAMDGFVVIEIDENGLTFIFDVDLKLTPGGTELLTLAATGYMRINEDGLAARLDMTLDTNFPESTGLVFEADFFLLINTTGKRVEILVPAFITGADGYDGPLGIIIPQAAPMIGGDMSIAEGDIALAAGADGILGTADDVDLDDAAAVLAAGGVLTNPQDYYIIAVNGSLSAAALTFEGDFLLIITQEDIPDPDDADATITYTTVMLQFNAELVLGPLGSLEVSGFLEITNDGAAGLLTVAFDLDALEAYDIAVSGSIFLAFNTYDEAYVLSAAVIAQFDLEDGAELEANLIQIQVSGSLSLGSLLSLSGSFFFKKTGSGATEKTIISVDATMSLPVLGTLNVDGDLILLPAGAVGSLVISLQSNAGLSAIGITYSATLVLKVNSTGTVQDDPGDAGTATIDANTVIVIMSGNLTLLNQFTFTGSFYFKQSGANINIRFDATLTIGFLGTLTATGNFNSSAAGFTAQLTLTVQTAAAFSSYGFALSGTFFLAINTTASNYTVTGLAGIGDQTIAPNGMAIFVTGDLEIFSTFKLNGTFGLTVSPTSTSVTLYATLSIYGIGLNVSGSATIYTDANPGFVLDLQLKLGASNTLVMVPVTGFTIEGSMLLKINTTAIARGGIAAQSVTAGGSVSVNLFGFTLSGSIFISISSAGFSITIPAGNPLTLDFFGFFSLSVSGSLNTNGNFSFTASLAVSIGNVDIFGFAGSVSVTFSNSGFSGSLSGTFGAFGIKVSAFGNFSVNNGVVSIAVGISLQITPAFSFKVWTPWKTYRVHVPALVISGTWRMTFGGLTTAPTIPPPPELARKGTGADANTLYLNIGVDAVHRGSFYGADDESYTLTRTGAGSSVGHKVMVDALGTEKEYDNVTKIVVVDTQSFNNFIAIDSAITAPVEINVGKSVSGENRFLLGGGVSTVQGGTGKTTVEYGAQGGTYIGGAGASNIKDHANGNLTVTAPGFANYVLTDGNLTYGNSLTVDAQGNTVGGHVMTFVSESVTRVVLNGSADAIYETTSLPDPDDGIASPWTGTATFNGSGSNSTIRANTASSLTLANGSITEGGVSITLNNIMAAELYGNSAANSFDLSGWTRAGQIDGAGGNDTVIASNNVNFDLTNTTLARTGMETLALTSIEIATLTGGAAANAFTVTDWTGTANLAGAGGNDTYTINLHTGAGTINITDSAGTDSLIINGTAGADTFVISGTSVTRGSQTVNYSGIENLTINAGDGNDTFTVNSTSATTILNGGDGNDTFTLNGNANSLTVNAEAGNDTVTVTASSAILTLNGGDGDDVFNVRAIGAAATVSTGTGTNTVNVGSVAPTLTGNLGGIGAVLTITGGGTDTLNVGAGDAGAKTGQMTGTQITGLGMAGSINYSGIDILGLTFGSGDDTFTIVSTHVGTTTVNSGGGADRINVRTIAGETTINAGAGADNIYVGTNAGAGDTGGNVNAIGANLTVNGDADGGTLHVDDTGDVAANTGTLTSTVLSGLGMTGTLTYGTLTTVNIALGSGGDTFTIESTHAGATNLSANNGNDTVNVRSTAGATSIDTGAGANTVNVGSLAPGGGGNVNGIAGLLTVTGGGTDTLNVDDTGDGAANTGTLTGTTLTGLGMTSGIAYSSIETLNINLGAGGDTFTIASTSAGVTNLNANDGNDTINVRATTGATNINTGAGTNVVNAGSLTPATNGNVNAIAGLVTVTGDGTDTLNVDDTGDGAANTGTLTGTTLTGLGMTSGIAYTGIETLNINLGSGDDTFTIVSTHVGTTTVNSGGGADRINVRTIAGETTINAGAGADNIYVGTNAGAGDTGGNVNAIGANLTVNGDADGGTLHVDDTGDVAANTGTLTSTVLSGLGMTGTLTYGTLTTVNIALGSGGDTFTIESTHAGATNLSANNGNDTVNVRSIAGATTVDTGAGNDVVNVGSLTPATGGTLNGILGLLTLNGGTGTDQLFIDDRGDGVANTGVLTGTTLTGLGMSQGIAYANFAHLGIGLGSGNDSFTISSTHTGTTHFDAGAGNDTVQVVSIAGETWVLGNDGNDSITVNPAHVTGVNPIGAVLHLDGNEGADYYWIKLTGAGHSLINVLDTGVAGADHLEISGTPGADTFLLRKDYIVLLQYADADREDQLADYERINYNLHADRLTINVVAGSDYFAIDDNSAPTTINGGDDGDTYQIGQVFGPDFIGTGFDPGDLLETTRGWLSRGVSHALTIHGGAGEDTFVVYHNQAVLTLNGGDGDDMFVIRSFALAGSAENAEHYDPDRGATNVGTGGGSNQVAYAINAPVTIAGGGGFDTVMIIGTEFSDSIVVTQDGVYGAGLFVEFSGIEQLIVNLAEGNDHVWVLGTPAGVAVRIVGGLGSDTINLGGTPDAIEIAVLDGNGVVIGTTMHTFDPVFDLSGFLGPLYVEGGIGEGVPALEAGIGLPGEITGPLTALNNPNLLVNEEDQVDQLIVNSTGTAGPTVGTLLADRIHGLGMVGETTIEGNVFPAGVRYAQMESITVRLGSGNDTFTIESTITGRTLVDAGGGNDTINVRTISGHTTILGNTGDDTINVGTLAPGTGGVLTDLAGLLAIDGG